MGSQAPWRGGALEGWPDVGLAAAEVWIDDADERVVAGILADGTGVVVSLRDLGSDVSASFWDDELAKLAYFHAPSAAPIVEARIVADRYFVVTTEWLRGTPLVAHLAHGPLGSSEARTLLLAALDVVAGLHELGLSAAGTRLRSALVGPDRDGRERAWITTYGLHVDNERDAFEELRELALRVLALIGGRHERGGLVVPEGALTPELERVLRRAIGLGGPTFSSAHDMAAAVAGVADGHRARGAQARTLVRTRPMAAGAVGSIAASDLLLADDFVRSLPRSGA